MIQNNQQNINQVSIPKSISRVNFLYNFVKENNKSYNVWNGENFTYTYDNKAYRGLTRGVSTSHRKPKTYKN